MSQQDKVALVTGGARGIGRSYVEHLLAEGALVSFCDMLKEEGDATVEELSKKYPQRVSFCLCDVINDEQLEGFFQNTIKMFGGLDIVINNAGVSGEWDRSFRIPVDVNLNAVISGTRLGLKYMSKESGGRGGTVVNTGSTACLVPFIISPVYSATKAAVNQYTRSIGHPFFYKKSGVRVIAINPGWTETVLVTNSKRLGPHLPNVSEKELQMQKPDSVGKGLIELLQKAESGSLWTIKNGEPPVPTVFYGEAKQCYT